MALPLIALGALGRVALSVGARLLVRQGVKTVVRQGVRQGVRHGIRQGLRGSVRQNGKDFVSDLASDAVGSLVPNPLDPMGIVDAITEETIGFNPTSPMSVAGHFAERKLGYDPFDPVAVFNEHFGESSDRSARDPRSFARGGRDDRKGFGLDDIPFNFNGGLFGDLAKLGGISALAGLLLAVIRNLAEAGSRNRADGGPEASPWRGGRRSERSDGGVHHVGFVPIASAYSGDDKAPQLQQGVLLGA